MGREDKHKRGTSGYQSNPPFNEGGHDQRSNQDEKQTGRGPSEEEKRLSSDTDRRVSQTDHETRSFNSNERRFNLLVDSVPYMIRAIPFRFNGEIRYRVSLNEGLEHVFTWDSSLGQLRAIDDEASILPDNLEEAISEKLQSKV